MPNNFTNSRSVKVGDRVIIGDEFDRKMLSPKELSQSEPGQVFEVVARRDRSHGTPVLLDVRDLTTGKVARAIGYRWFAPAPAAKTTVVIPAEHRADIAHAWSLRKVHPEYRKVLKAASLGKSVDLATLRGALFAAMRAATTANGQSMGRRRDAEAIERAWNRLPGTLDEVSTPERRGRAGERKAPARRTPPQAALVEAREQVERTCAALVEQTDNRNRLAGEIGALQRQSHEANAEKQAALNYARALLVEIDPAYADRLDGFIDGWNSTRA